MSDPITRLNAALEGRYRIESELGEGGMATVYLAGDLRHERKVALKVMKPELAAIVGAERFLAEIKTTANLQHPHILPLFDSGEADSVLFYVMPYVDGESLRKRLDRENQLPVNEAIRIASDVAEALQAAHDLGVIHRDVKPANILLSQGRPLVSDFGIALAIGGAGGGRLTETGLSLGTPQYMSPEQATGDLQVGAATDIYGLGCVLYEMLVGEPPYTGPTPQAILGKVVAGERVSATKRRASVPVNVDGAIRKSLETVPADRFPSARDFVAALGDPDFRYDEAAVDTRHGPRFGWLSMALSFAAALAAGLVLGRGVPTSGDRAAQLMHFPLALPAGETFALNLPGSQLALSPDGEWIVFVTEEGGLYRRRIGEMAAEPIPGSEGAHTPFFSPDSRWLGFYARGRLLRVPIAGGPAVPIAETLTPNGVSWGDDGTVVFSTGVPNLVYRVNSTGGEPVLLTKEEGTVYQYPWVLPGGGAVLLTSREARSERRMVVLDLESGALDTLGLATRVAYASGHLLFSTAQGSLVAQPFDPDARRTTGEPFMILDSLAVGRGFGTGGGAFWPSNHGALVYATGGGDTRPLLIREGDSVTPLGIEGVWDPAYSPDGGRIAMRIHDLEGGQDIWILDREQGVLDRFTEQGYLNMTPVWTPDGERIAFMRHQVDDPTGSIYWQPADMSGPAELLLVSELRDFPGSWSPDGQTLAFSALRDGDRDVGFITVEESTPRWLLESEANESQPQVSPDGRSLAYMSDRSGRIEVYLQSLVGPSGRVTVSVDGGHSPRWDPEGDVLYYLTGAGQLVGATVDADRGLRVTSRQALFSARGFDVHPNGEEFVYVGGDAEEGVVLGWILNWPAMLPGG